MLKSTARLLDMVEAISSEGEMVCVVAQPDNDRSRFIGGSDAAAVLGVSPWTTPVELWREKTGRAPKHETVNDPAAARRYSRGHKLEPFIRDMVIEKLRDMGLEVELVATNERYTDHEHKFLACEIDFELRISGEVVINGLPVTLDRDHVNADAKSVTGFARKKWGEVDTEDVPIEYAAQFMHGLMITGRHFCLVAALRSFDDVDIYWVIRDDETIAAMRTKEVAFWLDCVLADEPPDPMVFDDIKALFPIDNGQATEATEDIAEKVKQLREVKARIKEFEEAETALQFEIAGFISPNARLSFNGADICTWKAQATHRLDQSALKAAHPDLVSEFTKASTVRVLRLPTSKKGKQ